MTTEEFSNSFDLLINAHLVPNISPLAFDEYEKSYFLTRAQEDLVLSYYNGKNPFQDSFEKTEELRRYLSSLVKTAVITDDLKDEKIFFKDDEGNTFTEMTHERISDNSSVFKLPDDLWFITYETVQIQNPRCKSISDLEVVPATQDEWHRLRKNPFRGCNERRALRFDIGNNMVEIACDSDIEKYKVRYLKKLSPIVLVDFTEEGLSIDGVTKVTQCEIHESLHDMICQGAVMKALQTMNINTNTKK